jgi:hypothetical protein
LSCVTGAEQKNVKLAAKNPQNALPTVNGDGGAIRRSDRIATDESE